MWMCEWRHPKAALKKPCLFCLTVPSTHSTLERSATTCSTEIPKILGFFSSTSEGRCTAPAEPSISLPRGLHGVQRTCTLLRTTAAIVSSQVIYCSFTLPIRDRRPCPSVHLPCLLCTSPGQCRAAEVVGLRALPRYETAQFIY